MNNWYLKIEGQKIKHLDIRLNRNVELGNRAKSQNREQWLLWQLRWSVKL